ncbi:MAG: HDOD domain-containing protein [Deltaproteobacteria bacterium]|nr:HDOD domain-containing protein [Deltaproteobacteria bacterium]
MMRREPATSLLLNLESGYSLPPLSVVAMKLVEMASDEMASVSDLARLIERDPSLAVRLLRLANSAFFCPGRPVATLRQAILRIGLDRLRIMGLSLSLRDAFPMGKIGAIDYEEFWRSSLYRALLAESLAAFMGGSDPEEAFVAGLVLEIGFLIFYDLFVKGEYSGDGLHIYPLAPLLSWERQEYGIDHRQVGEAALRYWRFPGGIVECQGFPGRETLHGEESTLGSICHVAGQFAALICQKAGDLPSTFLQAESCLGLDRDTVGGILVTTFQRVEEIAQSLKLEVDREKDIIELMEKANRALSRLSERLSAGQGSAPEGRLPSFGSLQGGEEQKALIADTLQAVAHEIRNPLMAVGGFAKRLASIVDPDSKGGKYVQVILEEAERLEQVLGRMTEKAVPGARTPRQTT